MRPQEVNEFHWRDGWMWKRLEGGAVRVRKYDPLDVHKLLLEITIPAYEWCSIIGAVSKRGQDRNASVVGSLWDRAKEFHGVEPRRLVEE